MHPDDNNIVDLAQRRLAAKRRRAVEYYDALEHRLAAQRQNVAPVPRRVGEDLLAFWRELETKRGK